jgi:hypothetical protein
MLQIVGKGRGLLATNRIAAGDVVLSEAPFTHVYVDPAAAAIAWDRGDPGSGGSGCAAYHPCVRRAAARRLDAHFAAAARQHPRHALRIAARILADLSAAPGGRAAQTWGAVRRLCRASVPAPPPEWAADLRAIRAALAGADAAAAAAEGDARIDERLFDAVFTDAWCGPC